MNLILLFSCPLAAKGLMTTEIRATLVVALGCFVAFVIWLLMLAQVISFLPKKFSVHKIMLWTFAIPGLNLFWVPWALLGTNSIVKKLQDKYSRINLFHAALGIQILSIPILLLYVLWFGVGLVVWNSFLNKTDGYEMLLLATIVLICMLIVLISYLVYLSLFVGKIKEHRKLAKKHPETHNSPIKPQVK